MAVRIVAQIGQRVAVAHAAPLAGLRSGDHALGELVHDPVGGRGGGRQAVCVTVQLALGLLFREPERWVAVSQRDSRALVC